MLIEQQEGMSFNINRAMILIVILIFVASLGFNIYIGLKGLREKVYNEGVKSGQDSIVQQIRSGAQVNFEDGVIVFIKKQ